MDTDIARKLALELISEHYGSGLWFGFDNAKRRFGCFRSHPRPTITLSTPCVELNVEADVRDTILHEIAHALTWREKGLGGHGRWWKYYANQLGARPTSCVDSTTINIPKGQWEADCPVCGETFSQTRQPRRVRACGKHRDPVAAALKVWRKGGSVVPLDLMHPQFQRDIQTIEAMVTDKQERSR